MKIINSRECLNLSSKCSSHPASSSSQEPGNKLCQGPTLVDDVSTCRRAPRVAEATTAPEQAMFMKLDRAASRGDTKKVMKLLDRGLSPDGASFFRPPLFKAIERGKTEVVALLLREGASTESIYLPGTETPLHVAIMDFRVDEVRLLLAAGADVWTESGHCDALLMAEARAPLDEKGRQIYDMVREAAAKNPQ